MSKLSEEYSKNFSGERKKEFDRRFREDFDPSMSELSNILRILEEMRQERANGGIMGGGMLVQPGFGGRRQGYRGDAAAKSSGAAASGRVGGSDVGESSTKSDPRDDGPDDRSSPVQNFTQELVRQGVPTKQINKIFKKPNFFQKAIKNPIVRTALFATNPMLGTIGNKAISARDVFTAMDAYDQIKGAVTQEQDFEDITLGADDLRADLTKTQKKMLDKRKGMLDVIGVEGVYDSIKQFDDKKNPSTLQDVKDYYQMAADGGRIGFQEGTPKTTMVGNLKITVKPNESTEMAVLNALMSDVEGVVDDETKQDYYKILMPQLRNQMSKSRYEGLMGELFGRKDGGIGYLLGE
jgi:hypothetical protein